jgi:hypothetical protein
MPTTTGGVCYWGWYFFLFLFGIMGSVCITIVVDGFLAFVVF